MASQRLISLDVFRGITVALMIIVNSPGNQAAYSTLLHSTWNGCTLADLVFPFFIFIVGVSVAITMTQAQTKNKPRVDIVHHIFKRTLMLFSIGLFLNAFPYHFDLATIRVYGVLQRIAVCYCIASILYLTTRLRTQLMIMLSLLLGYWLIMTKLPFDLSLEGNLAAYLDRLIFSSSHLYQHTSDPEGLLSTLPSIATVLLGNLTGRWLIANYSPQYKFKMMISFGIFIAMLGWMWGYEFPINKSLWSSSYVLWTGGIALLCLACCYWIIEIKEWKKWATAFDIFGMNSLLVYFLHILFLKLQAMMVIHRVDGSTSNLKVYITEHLFSWASSESASLLYACTYTLFWFMLLYQLQKRSIHT